MKVTKKDLLLLGIVFLVLLAADQITKAVAFAVMGENAAVTMVIPGFLGFNTVLNEGISFSIGEGGEWTQPIVIVNVNGYYDNLLQLFDRAVEEHFMRERHREMWMVVGSAAEVLPAIRQAKAWDTGYRKFAAI